MNNNKISIGVIIVVLVVAVGLVFAFRGRNTTPEQAAQPINQDDSMSMEVVEDTAVPATVETAAVPTQEQQVSTEVSVPAVKEGFVASDPGTVKLASGEVQLIEAFAFW